MRAVTVVFLIGCGGAARGIAPTTRLPGTCVDPLADATKRLTGAGEGDPLQASEAPDLDGDGTADIAFSFGLGVTTHTLLYVKRSACGHFVGDVVGPPIAGVTTRRSGFAEIKVLDVAACEGARCGCTPGELWFTFDGTTYQPDPSRSRPGSEKTCSDGVD